MKKRSLIFYIIFGIAILGLVFSRPILHRLSDYLSKSERVHANILLVEGWLPPYAIEMAYKEFQKNGYEYIIISGLKSISEYYMVSMNGYLIFYPKDKLINLTESEQHIIEIDAFSELEGKNCAHFNVFVNEATYILKIEITY